MVTASKTLRMDTVINKLSTDTAIKKLSRITAITFLLEIKHGHRHQEIKTGLGLKKRYVDKKL